jgi:hypothetical protein
MKKTLLLTLFLLASTDLLAQTVWVQGGYNATAPVITLVAGQSSLLPSTPFEAIWWDYTDYAMTGPYSDPNYEIILGIQVVNNNVTVQRGYDGTTAVAHQLYGKTYAWSVGPSGSPTLTPTFTKTPSPTFTFTPTNNWTSSNTPTITKTPTITNTPTITPTPTITCSPTPYPVFDALADLSASVTLAELGAVTIQVPPGYISMSAYNFSGTGFLRAYDTSEGTDQILPPYSSSSLTPNDNFVFLPVVNGKLNDVYKSYVPLNTVRSVAFEELGEGPVTFTYTLSTMPLIVSQVGDSYVAQWLSGQSAPPTIYSSPIGPTTVVATVPFPYPTYQYVIVQPTITYTPTMTGSATPTITPTNTITPTPYGGVTVNGPVNVNAAQTGTVVVQANQGTFPWLVSFGSPTSTTTPTFTGSATPTVTSTPTASQTPFTGAAVVNWPTALPTQSIQTFLFDSNGNPTTFFAGNVPVANMINNNPCGTPTWVPYYGQTYNTCTFTPTNTPTGTLTPTPTATAWNPLFAKVTESALTPTPVNTPKTGYCTSFVLDSITNIGTVDSDFYIFNGGVTVGVYNIPASQTVNLSAFYMDSNGAAQWGVGNNGTGPEIINYRLWVAPKGTPPPWPLR